MRPNAVTRAIGEVVMDATQRERRVVITSPPRHGKTDTILHAFAWLLARDPTKLHAYATYGQELANSKSRRARMLARETGVELDPTSTSVKEWRTLSGGGLLATGAGGPLTGQGITGLGIVDDPFKNRQEAESRLIRDRVAEWFNDVFYTRLEPGSSVILIATRWHLDDLPGRLVDDDWEEVRLPALDDEGNALWPERYPVSRLEKIREKIGEYSFQSLYQGRPRVRGGRVFQGQSFYTHFPEGGFQEAHGFDAAYTSKTHADYTVVLRGRKYGDHLYLTHMIREQREPLQMISMMKAAGVEQVTWFLSGSEKGLVGFLEDQGISVKDEPAQADKFVRAQPVATAWNSGKVHLPHPDPEQAGHGLEADWVRDVVDELSVFTGVSDPHDDIVDALAALYYELDNTLEAFTL